MTDISQPVPGTPPTRTGLRLKRLPAKRPARALEENGNEPKDPDILRCAHPHDQVSLLFPVRDYITGDPFQIAFCHSCKLHVTIPAPSDADMGKYYPAGYYGSGQRFTRTVEWLLHRLHNYRVHQIEQHESPGKVLDIGCGRGLLLDKLRKHGWTPLGTELSEDAAAFARNRLKLPVLTQPLEEIGLPSSGFDLVILWHVLEHVQSPRDMVREVARILKPGGTLLVAVPNFGSWEAQWSRDHWFHLDVPRHLTHFTPKTLGRMLGEAGLPITDINFFSSEYDFFSFVQTVENKLGLRHNLLYNLLRTRSAKVMTTDGREENLVLQSVLALLLAIPLAGLSVLYAPFIAALRRGGTLAAYGTKIERR